VVVCGDNPDAVEYLLRSGFNPWSGDDEYQHSDAWYMIGDNGAGRVLARLLGIMADTSSAEPLGACLRSAWDERGPRAFDGASVPVLDVLLERGYTIGLKGLLRRACRYADIAVLSWAIDAAPRLDTPVDIEEVAKCAVTVAYDDRLRSTSRPEAVIRWLLAHEGGGYVPAPDQLRDLLGYVASESGDTGCALFLLERWPHEAAALGPQVIGQVVQHVCSRYTRYQCTRCAYPRLRRRCCSYSTTAPLLERLVQALEQCHSQSGPDTRAELEGHIDLWQTLLDVASRQWPEKAHYGTCAALRYAYERCSGGDPAPCPRRDHPGPAPRASWTRWCHIRPISVAEFRPTDDPTTPWLAEEEGEEDAGEGGDSVVTTNGYTHNCNLRFRMVAWLRACGLLLDAGRARRRTGKMARHT
jgi:hypothetical protein